jgi:hypothetical protein
MVDGLVGRRGLDARGSVVVDLALILSWYCAATPAIVARYGAFVYLYRW